VITPEFSLYLDVVRFVAACLVLISHANDRELSTRIIPMAGYGSSAVVVFFVLSGFVIAYVTATRERSARDYAVSRMARIYSVALPAVLVTLCADLIGERLQPALYADNTTHDWWLLRFFSSLLFMNEFWGISITTYSNIPYWSLCYEMWYYILFGVFVFWKGPWRPWALAAAVLLAGPKILLLIPVWLMGVALYRYGHRINLPKRAGVALFALSWVLLVLFHAYGVAPFFFEYLKSLVGPAFHVRMTWSRYFLSDYLLGLIVVMNFVGFRAAQCELGKLLLPIATPIKVAAGFTLSIYLFHKPLILFFTALIAGNPDSLWFWASVMASTTITIVVLGLFTEHRKDGYRRFFDWLLARVETELKRWMPRLLPRSSGRR
jgi:peptidoglycan/LPS O-acetylase OafA/YrhL